MNTKNILLGILCLFVTSTAFSQISTGFSIGVVQTNLKSDLFSQENAGLGYRVGFDFAVPVGKFIEIQPSIAYVTKGADAQATSYLPEQGLTLGSHAYEYQSFQGQMLLAVQPVKGIRLQAGAYLDAMSNRLDDAHQNVFIGDLTTSNIGTPVTSLNEAFSGIDYGPVFGLSFGANRFRMTAQYMHGLANLYNYTKPDASGHEIKTQTLSIAATYYFAR